MDKKINKVNLLEEINMLEILHAIKSGKYLILTLTLVFSLLMSLLAFNLPNIYKSTALLASLENQTNSNLAQFGGIASLAGISVDGSADDKSDEAIQRIQTYDFFINHFLPSIALENLMAVKSWNSEGNLLSYDAYDPIEKKWSKNHFLPWLKVSKEPSKQVAYKKYKKILYIEKDRQTSFVRLSVSHESPHISKKWADLIVDKINESMRNEERLRTTKSLEFLNNQITITNYKEIKESIAALQEEQMKSLMLVEANKSYIFKILDYPIAPEEKSAPNRIMYILLGIFFGIIIGSVAAIYRFYKSHE